MVLRNYVELEEGKPARLHFVEHDIIVKDVFDRDLGRVVPKNALVLQVDKLDGKPVAALLSVLAGGLADALQPWVAEHRYRAVDIIITKRGTGYQTRFSVEPAPRS